MFRSMGKNFGSLRVSFFMGQKVASKTTYVYVYMYMISLQ